jgi:hypothetical protein
MSRPCSNSALVACFSILASGLTLAGEILAECGVKGRI